MVFKYTLIMLIDGDGRVIEKFAPRPREIINEIEKAVARMTDDYVRIRL